MNEIELKKRAQRIVDRMNALGFTKDGKPVVIDQAFELVAAGEGLRNQHVLRVMAKKATELDAAVGTFGQGMYAASFKPGTRIPPLVLPRIPDDGLIEALLVERGHYADDEYDADVGFAFEQWRLIMKELAERAGVESVTEESEAAAERAWVEIVNRLRMDDREEILHLEGFIRNAGLMGEFAKYVARVAVEQEAPDIHVGSAPDDVQGKALADEAYENYNFGAEVVEANGWETWSGTGRFRRAVFLSTTDGEDTRKVIFEVQVTDAVKCSVSQG